MARIPKDDFSRYVSRQLLDDQRHITETIDRVWKSNDTVAQTQQLIRASTALIKRAGSVKWPMKVPTLPKRTGTLRAQNSASECKSS